MIIRRNRAIKNNKRTLLVYFEVDGYNNNIEIENVTGGSRMNSEVYEQLKAYIRASYADIDSNDDIIIKNIIGL